MHPLDNCPFYGILDSAYVSHENWLPKYKALVKGGAGIVQVRSKRPDHADYRALVEIILNYRESLPKPPNQQPHLILNDDLDLCLAYPALGIHLEHNDATPERVRAQLGPDRLLGISATNQAEVDRANKLAPGILSYFSIGSIFPSKTKPEAPTAGLGLVRYAAQSGAKLPFFCIGGIDRTNIRQIRDAGASRIATIADVLRDLDTEAAVRQSIALLKG